MGALLREALRRLCAEIGWSYAVFWRAVGFRSPMHLVWEDGHCERSQVISGFDAVDLLLKERGMGRSLGNDHFNELGCEGEDKVVMLFHKTMASQVHVVGDGIIGQAALTGNYQWITQDVLNGSTGLAEIKNHFLSGIQTIVVIPVLPHGVVQLGSTQLAVENVGLINHVKSLFAQLGCVPGALLSDVTHKSLAKKSPLPASSRLSVPGYESQSVCTRVDISLPKCHDQISRSPASRSVTQASLGTQSNGTIASSASEMTRSKVITSPGCILDEPLQSVVHPVVKSIHQDSQLSKESSGILFDNQAVRIEQQLLPHVSKCCYENLAAIVSSGLYSSSLAFSEERVLSACNSNFLDSANNSKPMLDNTKALQRGSYGCMLPSSTQDSDIMSLFGSKELSTNGNDIVTVGSLPVGTSGSKNFSHGNSTTIRAPHLCQKIDSNDTDLKSGVSVVTHLSGRNPRSLTAVGKHKQENDSFQALDVPSSEYDLHASCFEPAVGTSEGCWMTCSQPFQGRPEHQNPVCEGNDLKAYGQYGKLDDGSKFLHELNEKTSTFAARYSSSDDLFDLLGINLRGTDFNGCSNDVFVHKSDVKSDALDAHVTPRIAQMDSGPVFDTVTYENSYAGIFTEDNPDQLLDAVISKLHSGVKQNSDDNLSYKTSLTKVSSSSLPAKSSVSDRITSSDPMQNKFYDLSPAALKSETEGSTFMGSACSADNTDYCTQKHEGQTSQISLWVQNGQNINHDSVSAAECKRTDDIVKSNKKRARPGECPRPRPKDRQMIQDRVKELREIVPNGAKLSIDALFEKTIKHMLFLQSVTKHADKLKEAGEPKIISKEGGLLLKDNFEGGATWAFEVGSQSMICPIIVEDLNPPRQMLVEMLCEERGFFLEIADLIRGLGLTILKGVMEAREDKIWAHFAVEANRDVTRMEIFLSLVRLLEPTMASGVKLQNNNNIAAPQNMFHQQSSIPATGLSDPLR